MTRYGYGEACKRIEIVEASHPVPDAKGREAARRILERVQGLGADDRVLCLISGGASALLSLPTPGLTLEDKQEVNRALLKSGANIVEMNTVRKHLSMIKGGRLAIAAQPAQVLSWLISDVPNDDPGVIGSGPTVADKTTFADALAVLAKYHLDPRGLGPRPPEGAVLPARSRKRPSPAIPGWPTSRPSWSPRRSARSKRRRPSPASEGCEVIMLGDNLEGEARELGAGARTTGTRSPEARRQAGRDPVRR